ncbi:unnamed protein product [Trichobilharzia szidati]|nr:unnamed protein product [Trichobilharzia szidati]
MDLSVRDVNEPCGDVVIVDRKQHNTNRLSTDANNPVNNNDDFDDDDDVKMDSLDNSSLRLRQMKSTRVTEISQCSVDGQIHQRVTKMAHTSMSKLYSDGDAQKHQFVNHIDQNVSSTAVDSDYNYYYRLCFTTALMLRLVLVIFSVWQDTVRWPDGQLRFTDVDYDVFADGARAFLAGKNMYIERPTYRYSPLIALVLAPGYWLFSDNGEYSVANRTVEGGKSSILPALAHLWGKLIFIMADLLCGYLQYIIIHDKLIKDRVVNRHPDQKTQRTSLSFIASRLAISLVAFGWLFNPVTAVVSVRGNADALQSCLVITCLWCILKRRIALAGLLYGLCIHLRIYPIIYALSIYLWLMKDDGQNKVVVEHLEKTNTKKVDDSKDCQTFNSQLRSLIFLFTKLPNRNHFIFGFSCLLSLITLTGLCYAYFGGMLFLQQACLYHFSRSDFKHNFAPHFLTVYLLSGQKWWLTTAAAAASSGEVIPTGAGWDVNHRNWLSMLWSNLTNSLIHWGSGSSTGSVDNQYSGSMNAENSLSLSLLLENLSTINLMEGIFKIATVLPCLLLIPSLSLKLHSNLGLCWFVLTYMFVTFNRVS